MRRRVTAVAQAVAVVAMLLGVAAPARAADLDCLIEPFVTVTLTPRAEGLIETMLVDRGDVVKEGQVLATLDSGLERATSAVTSARAELANKRLTELELQRSAAELALRTIRSPINGVVVQRLMAPGEFTKQAPILRLAQIDPLRVEVFAPVALLGRINVGMRGTVMPEPPVGGSHPARVTVIDRVVDAASGTFGVRLELPNPNYKLPAGLKCKVRF